MPLSTAKHPVTCDINNPPLPLAPRTYTPNQDTRGDYLLGMPPPRFLSVFAAFFLLHECLFVRRMSNNARRRRRSKKVN
jgi:hypothetical protein